MNLENVKPLEIDAYLGKIKNRVALVSVELEGAWDKLPDGVFQVEPDSSVFSGRMPPGAIAVGEIPVGPVAPAGIAELIKRNHPDKANHTCGMHVHMSFETLWHYHLLMVPEYQETICHYLGLWAKENKIKDTHCIWSRLRGESQYCRKEFHPDAQASKKQKSHQREVAGHRYTIIHYCGRLNTIECRVLPMMQSVKQSISAVQRVIDITNACILVLGAKNPKDKVKEKIALPDNMVYEESIIQTL